jgi:putative ABC transport system permease protein
MLALPISYHWHNVFARRTTTLLTVLVICAVVGTLVWILGFRNALQDSLALASDEYKLLVIRPGATGETTSALPVADFNKLTQLTDVARDEQTGEPLISPEMLVQVSLCRVRQSGTTANVAVRGVTERALQVHRNVRLLGPMFSTGGQEVIVGRRAAEQFSGLRIGDLVDLGYGQNRSYRVVGYFTADGAPVESEIWGYLPSLLNAYNRDMYSSAAVRVRDGAVPQDVIRQIAGAAIDLEAQTERGYWHQQTRSIRVYLGIVAVIVIVMGLAAVFAIANTMFASVAGRTREIAMLRTIGFGRWQVLLGFLLEAVLLALLGGVLGCAACALWLRIVGSTKDMYGTNTFTTLAFDIHLTPAIIAAALTLVAVIGALGALVPAWRAARVQVISALREA